MSQKGPEAVLLDQIIGTHPGREGIAVRFGWESVHFRPARTQYGWRTPVQGSMGTGWPDLLLVRGRRLVAAELKADGKKLELEQRRVLDLLDTVREVETYEWRPADWDAIINRLR
jgi:hypothetical protein